MAESNENEPRSAAGHTEDILTVEQLNERIAEGIESLEELHGVRSVGEITDLGAGNSAHYFTLTDGDCELRCVLWESRYQNMDIDLENGMEVVLEGNVDFWREGGEISLKPWEVTAVGEGEQAAAIDRLERELEQRGWFDDDHEDVDVIIAGRGGGSDTDLMAFNTEEVAEAIFTANTPVITAVGHTDDRFIADKVADMAAITPTRAGEYVAGSREEYIEGTIEPLERELEDAYEALEQEREYERELVEGERKLTYYRVAIVVLVLVLLIVLVLWQVM